MKISPVQFPYFFYGTLKKEGKFYGLIEQFKDESKPIETAYVQGSLYVNKYVSERAKCVTAAFSPKGNYTIKGHLFHAKPKNSLELQSVADLFEFNFHKETECLLGHLATERVYLRNIVVCNTEGGETYLAWCYFYHSTRWPLNEIIKPNASGIVEFIEPSLNKSAIKSRDDYR